MADQPNLDRFKALVDGLLKSQKDGEFTDFQLVCEGVEFRVHRVIICALSPVLRAACKGSFEEASTGVYNMNEDPLFAAERMIEYFYTTDYEAKVVPGSGDPPMGELQVHARMYVLADKYQVEGLKKLASKRYLARLKLPTSGIAFLESIPDVYILAAIPTGPLRQGVVRFARQNLPTYIKDPETRAVYEKIAADVPEFIKDVLDLHMKEPQILFNSSTRRARIIVDGSK